MGSAFDDLVLRRAIDEYERQSMESANCGSPFDDWADAEEDERQEFIDYARDDCMEVVSAWNTRTPSEAVLVEALEGLTTAIVKAWPTLAATTPVANALAALAAAKGERV